MEGYEEKLLCPLCRRDITETAINDIIDYPYVPGETMDILCPWCDCKFDAHYIAKWYYAVNPVLPEEEKEEEKHVETQPTLRL
jgi:hypothetical protein